MDLRTAALQFSAAADVAAALVVGARSDRQILEDWNSLQSKIPKDFWSDLKEQQVIEAAATIPGAARDDVPRQNGPESVRLLTQPTDASSPGATQEIGRNPTRDSAVRAFAANVRRLR